MLQTDAIVVVDNLSFVLFYTLNLPINFLVQIAAIHAMHHREQFSGKPKLCLLNA